MTAGLKSLMPMVLVNFPSSRRKTLSLDSAPGSAALDCSLVSAYSALVLLDFWRVPWALRERVLTDQLDFALSQSLQLCAAIDHPSTVVSIAHSHNCLSNQASPRPHQTLLSNCAIEDLVLLQSPHTAVCKFEPYDIPFE